jgi:hypothetical protein
MVVNVGVQFQWKVPSNLTLDLDNDKLSYLAT